jgi:prevent-host-death family protein
MPSGMPQVPCYECAFRRWLWALEFHHGLLGTALAPSQAVDTIPTVIIPTVIHPNAVLIKLSILSIIDLMRSVSATDAKQRLAALLDAAQREPVLIRRQNRDVAVIMSAQEYERMRDLAAADFHRFCDRVAAQAKARGLTESALRKLLKD